MWEILRGHQNQVEMFRRAIGRGRVAHAYLFIGPSGIGKRMFARMMTQSLLCEQVPDSEFDACGKCPACKQVLAGTHPDLLEIGCPEGKRELPIALIAGRDENRGKEGLCHDIAMRPMSANRRIAIIDDANTMNEASANSLLKTLEEPPAGAILFLMTPSLDSILPTIRSRCQMVRFSPLPEHDIAELLVELGDAETPAQAEKVAQYAEGNLATAQQLLDPGMFQLKTTVSSCLSELPVDSLQSVKKITSVFDELGGDTSQQRQNMRWANQFCIEVLRLSIRESADPLTTERLMSMLDRCFEAESHLRQTMPVLLCLESLFDDLARLSRVAVPV
jgi:DNA polymerase-3 subunit delta'